MADSSDRELIIFSDARLLPPEQRAAFLETACGGDQSMRRQVEALLLTADETSTFMETPAGELLNPGEFLRPATLAEKPGDRIDHYELLEKIGEGGCGIVYKAKQDQPVRRFVALKIIKLGMDTRSVIARFEAERQALALMDHPNIAKVLDAGATDTGRPYFVMELVEGVKITDFCDQNNLSTHERLALFIQVCQAVQHAHQKGIIHRDIKPSNILVKMNDGVPLPKIIDFGIAKATHGKLTDQTVFTALEQFIGTPAYMSPEQADAREVDIDTRSDIYSLGVLLYELLTAHTPFDAKELLQSGLDETRRTIREQEPLAPSDRLTTMTGADLRAIAMNRKTESSQLIYQVRGDLDWIVMKALEKDRSRRYETTYSLAMDIWRHLNNEPVAARPPNPVYKFQKWVRRNKLAFATGAAIGLALALGVVISVWSSIKEREARIEADNLRSQAQANEKFAEDAQRKAVEAQKKAEAEATKSRQEARFLEDMLNGVNPTVAMGADTTLLKKILDNTSKQINAGLTNQPEVEAELRDTLGQVYWAIGDLTNAETMDRVAVSLRIALAPNSAEAAESMEHLSHVLWREGKLAEAERIAQSGIQLQTDLYGVTNLAVARSLEDYAAILNTRGLGVRSVSALRQALDIKETLLGKENLEVADTMQDLSGLLLSLHSKVTEAVDLERTALATRQKLLGATNPIVVIDTLTLDKIEEDLQGRSADEEATLDKLVDAQRQFYGGLPHPSLAQSLNTLASVLKNEGKLAESEKVRREALDMQRRLLGPDSAEVAQTVENLGNLLVAENKLTNAEPMLTTAYNMRRKMFGDGSALTINSLVDLGTLFETEGKTDEATNLYLSLAGGKSACAANADYQLGLMYVHGKGVPQDAVEGAQWIFKAAGLGLVQAETEMGVLYFYGTGVSKEEQMALGWFRKATMDSSTLGMKSTVLKALAGCYCTVGKGNEAISTLQQILNSNPLDVDAALSMAALQVWYGENEGYETTRQNVMQTAQANAEASVAEISTKTYCLEPSTNAGFLQKALGLAQRGVELRNNTPTLSWQQLSLGMVQYRLGQYTNAENTLALAEQDAGKYTDVPPTARFYRAMCLYSENRIDEARRLFVQTESQMTPYPQDLNRPIVGDKAASHDVIVTWLAYREARALLNSSSND